MDLAVPGTCPAPMAPKSVVVATVHVTPLSCEISTKTVSDDVAASVRLYVIETKDVPLVWEPDTLLTTGPSVSRANTAEEANAP